MSTQTLEQIIHESLKGLSPESLAEIADFVNFVRKREFQPQTFREEMEELALRQELKQMHRDVENHLEEEFADYEQLYPRE